MDQQGNSRAQMIPHTPPSRPSPKSLLTARSRLTNLTWQLLVHLILLLTSMLIFYRVQLTSRES